MKVIKAFIHQHRAADVIQALKVAGGRQPVRHHWPGHARGDGCQRAALLDGSRGHRDRGVQAGTAVRGRSGRCAGGNRSAARTDREAGCGLGLCDGCHSGHTGRRQ